MWIFLPFGFLSVVQHKDKPDVVLVRARASQDLEAFRGRGHCPSMGKTIYLRWADYPYRAEVPKVEFAQAMFEICLSLDWPNFKNEVGKVSGHERSSVYMDIWSRMRAAQDDGRLEKERSRGSKPVKAQPVGRGAEGEAQTSAFRWSDASREERRAGGVLRRKKRS